MAGLALGGLKISLVKDFERIVEIRAERHEHLRQRNNVTSCRSPTRELDTSQIKNDLKKKRYQEFLRRRSVSPEPCCSKHCTRKNYSPKIYYSLEQHSSSSKMLHANIQNTPIDKGRSAMSLPSRSSVTDGPSSHRRTSLRSERQEKGQASSLVSTSTHNILNVQRETFIHTEKIHQNSSIQRENRIQKRTLQDTGVQTDCGFVNVKESDVQQLARYLQEAMWREEAVKKKFTALQENISSLMNASTLIWTSRCSEDLLRNKIKALEEQMHVCLQKFPKDDMKKLVLQMEKQKLVYEEEALIALQKATQDKTEANSKAATLQEALITAKAEAVKWESLYEELNMNFSHLRDRQLLSEEQLQQLHTQVELYMSRETELKEEVLLLRQEKQELQYNICLLEEDNETLREEAQHLRDDSSEGQDFVMSRLQLPEKTEPQVSARTESQVEEQLHYTQEKLQMKERECSELQTDLHTMEQECKSSQARLLQCREELRQLSHHRSSQTACGSRWRSCLFFLLLLIMVQVAVLWLSYPPFREQVEYLYSDIETRIKNYLMEMDSPQHSGCFRPI